MHHARSSLATDSGSFQPERVLRAPVATNGAPSRLLTSAPPSAALIAVMSVALHALGAVGLGYLPSGETVLPLRRERVAVSLAAPAPPPAAAPVVEAPPMEAPPPPVETARRVREAAPVEAAPVEAEPTPAAAVDVPAPVTSAPPSADDIFGDPPPAPDLMAGSAGSGAYAVAAGEGGPAGGRAGGTGTTLRGGGSGPTASSEADDEGARRRARLAYKRELERLLRGRTSYPRAALRERLEGRVELALRIGHDGALLGVRVAESSGYALLDEAAMSSARLGRLPAPPDAAGLRDSDELVVPLVYVVR